MAKAQQDSTQLRELISRTESLLTARERTFLSQYKLCASDLAILTRLLKKSPRSITQIAPKIGLTSGSMTTAIQRLKNQELVITKTDQKDRRVVQVDLTPKGKKLIQSVNKARNELFFPITHSLTDRERNVLSGLLKKIRKAANK